MNWLHVLIIDATRPHQKQGWSGRQRFWWHSLPQHHLCQEHQVVSQLQQVAEITLFVSNPVLPEEQYIRCIYGMFAADVLFVFSFPRLWLNYYPIFWLIFFIRKQVYFHVFVLIFALAEGKRCMLVSVFMLLICSIFPVAWLSVLLSFFLYTLFLPPAAAGLHSGFLLIRILIGIIYQRT